MKKFINKHNGVHFRNEIRDYNEIGYKNKLFAKDKYLQDGEYEITNYYE